MSAYLQVSTESEVITMTAMQPTTTKPTTPSEPRVPGFLTVRQLSAILGISEGAAYMRVYRAKDKFKVVKVGHSLLVPQDVALRLFQELQER